jgi:hypothetical protein
MPIFRRKRDPESIRGNARIGLYGAEGVESVHVAWNGDDAAFHFLVPAYLDKILFNLGRMPEEQQALLGRVEDFIVSARDRVDRYGSGLFASAGVAPLASDPPPGRPFAEIEVEVAFLEERGRAGATTDFRPMEASNERVAELGLWMLWDLSVAAAGGDDGAVHFLLDVVEAQCGHYRRNGMPTVTNLGAAPFLGLTGVLSRDMGENDHSQDTGVDVDARLASQLREDVDAVFPRDGAEPEPSWGFFVLPNTQTAPIVGLSRDPRSGHRLTPVFFVAASERERLAALMLGLFEGTNGKALLFHQCGEADRPFLFVPLLYHLVDEEGFVDAMRGYLSGSQGVAWFEERCELLIEHDGRSYRAVPGAEGSVEVVIEAAD